VLASVPETAAFPFALDLGSSTEARMTVTFGQGVADIATAYAAGLYAMSDAPTIEPALVVVQDDHRVLSILAAGAGMDSLFGTVYCEEGYNCRIAVLPDTNEVRISAIHGSGAGIPCDPLDPAVVLCNAVLLRVNGLQGGEEGGFRLFGGHGVEIIPDPDNHQLILRSRSDLSELTCEE